MHALIPSPKSVQVRPGQWEVDRSTAVRIQVHGLSGPGPADWLASCLRQDFGVTVHRDSAGTASRIHIGLLDSLIAAGLVEPAWRNSPAFRTEVGREQGYILDISAQRIVIAAIDEPGLQNGAASILQILSPAEGRVVAASAHIEDWPDFRFRAAADWLLNVEINRWGYERGDGRDALLARMKRKIDLAVRHKVNTVWFDGFGWSTTRFPGYAGFARELAVHARKRHVRLVHAGYGGGYGFAYQKSQLYQAPYQGRIFENRRSYPDGEVYECMGLSRHEGSRRYGTCLSNQELLRQKIEELTCFVRECQPGMLYIHDIDTGSFAATMESWGQRCPRCKERWPDGEFISDRGGVSAYGNWFRQLADAINQVRSDDGSYVARRDCGIIFVGPLYTSTWELDPIWQRECDYFALLSRAVGPQPNVQFGIREQVTADPAGRPRVSMLRESLDRVGHRHGVLVIALTGGDNYCNDALVPVGAAFQSCYLGAETVYTKTMGVVCEPVQLIAAEYGWHASAPGAFGTLKSRDDALALLQACEKGLPDRPEILGDDGLLRRACDRLYGPDAGSWIARILRMGVGRGPFPVVTGWGAVSREMAAIQKPATEDAAARITHWNARLAATSQAIEFLSHALAQPMPNADVASDLEWFQIGLEMGQRMCGLMAACWAWKLDPSVGARSAVLDAIRNTESYLRDHVSTDTTDPIGGDIAVWYGTVEKVRALVG